MQALWRDATDANGCTTTNSFTLTGPVILAKQRCPATFSCGYRCLQRCHQRQHQLHSHGRLRLMPSFEPGEFGPGDGGGARQQLHVVGWGVVVVHVCNGAQRLITAASGKSVGAYVTTPRLHDNQQLHVD
ncbi:MAG: hypothetical protein IPP17_19515 [Bacteroidetes bacterium]|nr:hypothetical protein [Bacteroidota bacterium]